MYGGPKKVMRSRFIQERMGPIQTELARGEGEHLVVLAELSGCPETLSQDFAKTVRSQMADEFFEPAINYDRLLNRLDSTIASTPILKAKCTLN